jgi:hypothetical protein
MNNLDILKYAEFLVLTLMFIVLVLRAFYLALIIKQDPIKAIKPDLRNNGLYKWLVLRELVKKNEKVGNQMS